MAKRQKLYDGSAVSAKGITIGFGTRAVSDQNFSKIIALPKQALTNLGNNIRRVNVELVQEKETKFIRLTPAATSENTEEEGAKT